jgi:membrane protein
LGSVVAAIAWLIVSLLFSWYAENFGSYNKTYGSLGAIIAFMFWIWLSIIVGLIGGELNAETEHQTVRDTTIGGPKPMGERGATMADTVGAKQDCSRRIRESQIAR